MIKNIIANLFEDGWISSIESDTAPPGTQKKGENETFKKINFRYDP